MVPFTNFMVKSTVWSYWYVNIFFVIEECCIESRPSYIVADELFYSFKVTTPISTVAD